jgi:NADPH2:quinone reductase
VRHGAGPLTQREEDGLEAHPQLGGRLIFKNQSLTGFTITSLPFEAVRASLTELFDLAVRGQLRVRIDGRHPLEHAARAHRALEGRTSLGKVVLVP